MNRKLVLIPGLILLLIGICSTTRVQEVEASDTIYIRADGSVDGTDKITSLDNVTYMFTANINDSISIERSNIILDGDDFNLDGPGSSGIYFTNRHNVTIRNINMVGFNNGVFLNNSTQCHIIRNSMENVTTGVYVYLGSNFNNISENSIVSYGNGVYIRESSNCTISNNNITCERADNKFGIYLYYSLNSTVRANTITECQACVYIYYSDHSTLFGNNLTNSGWDQDGGGVWVDRSNFNKIHENYITGSKWHGIEIFRSSNNSISENEITSNTNRGIMVNTFSNFNNITGNSIIENYKGIEASSSSYNNRITSNYLSSNTYEAVVLDYSWNNTISGNNIVDNSAGIMIGDSSGYNNITDNNITDCGQAINVIQGSYNYFHGNNLTNNYSGLSVRYSTGNTLRETTMVNNTCSFILNGYELSHFTNYVDASNTVEDRPIYYWVDAHHASVSEDAACVILVECTNITVHNVNLSICNWQGVALAYSRNITISDSYIANNDEYAIWLWNSSECYIVRNYLKGFIGLQLDYSSNNTFFGNTLTAGGNWGSVNLVQSHNNTFYHNNFTDNYRHFLIDDFSVNHWDYGYPAGGNYWDDYQDRYSPARDDKSGPSQNETGSDGIWDTPYTLNPNNIDNYPIVPEFPSLIILPLFMMTTLLAILARKRKQRR